MPGVGGDLTLRRKGSWRTDYRKTYVSTGQIDIILSQF